MAAFLTQDAAVPISQMRSGIGQNVACVKLIVESENVFVENEF